MSASFGEEDFQRVFPYFGMVAIFDSEQKPSIPQKTKYELWANLGPGLKKEKAFKNVNSFDLDTKIESHPLTLICSKTPIKRPPLGLFKSGL